METQVKRICSAAVECFAEAQGRYILGVDLITPKSTVVGYNRESPKKTWHRGASCPAPPAFCGDQQTPEANPNNDENPPLGALIWGVSCSDASSMREGRTEDTTVSYENNMGTTMLWAGLQIKKRSWIQCLQGSGPLTRGGVCMDPRPIQRKGGPVSLSTPEWP